MKTFILILGAWLNAGIWDRIALRIRDAGHEVLTPELPGNGRDATPASQVNLQTYVDAIATLISEREDVVLVGHSMAGIVVSNLTEMMPKKITHLFYLAAFMLPDGASVVSFQEAQRALRSGQQGPPQGFGTLLERELGRTPSQTILDQVCITTSGFFSAAPFAAALAAFGPKLAVNKRCPLVIWIVHGAIDDTRLMGGSVGIKLSIIPTPPGILAVHNPGKNEARYPSRVDVENKRLRESGQFYSAQ